MLEKRNLLKKVLVTIKEKEFMTRGEIKSYLFSAIFIFGTSYLILNSLDAIKGFSEVAFVFAIPVGITIVPIGMGLLVLFFAGLISKKIKVIEDPETYLLKYINKEEASLLRQLVGGKAYGDMDLLTKKVILKLEEIEEKFIEEDVLRGFHSYINKNESAIKENLAFFKESLEKFNKIHNWQSNEVSKVNIELMATGWESLPVKDKSLKLVIEEND